MSCFATVAALARTRDRQSDAQNGKAQYFWVNPESNRVDIQVARSSGFLLWGEPGLCCFWGWGFCFDVFGLQVLSFRDPGVARWLEFYIRKLCRYGLYKNEKNRSGSSKTEHHGPVSNFVPSGFRLIHFSKATLVRLLPAIEIRSGREAFIPQQS